MQLNIQNINSQSEGTPLHRSSVDGGIKSGTSNSGTSLLFSSIEFVYYVI